MLQLPPKIFPLDLDAVLAAASSSRRSQPQAWHQSGQCPEGTVAIRRTMVKDVLRAGDFEGYKMKKDGLASVPQPSRPQILSGNGHEVNRLQVFLLKWSKLVFELSVITT